jgi:hypothetical protein
MIKKCRICKREFETYDFVRNGKRGIIKRPVRSITCSRRCSLINAHNIQKEVK